MNPAYHLAEILKNLEYGNGKGAVQVRREYAKQRGMSEDALIRLAMQYLLEVEERIGEVEALNLGAAPYRSALPKWQTGITHGFTTNANSSVPKQPRPVISEDQYALLLAFGNLLESRGAALMPAPAVVDSVAAAIDEAVEFVKSIDDVSEETRHYLLALLERIRSALRSGHAGDFRSAVHEFAGATVMAEETAPAETKSRWQKLRETVLRPVLTNAGGGVLSQGVINAVGLIGA
ncbi:hypothetical protein MWU57_08120 [Isoptericola sp. S6320L]|uniref:hypothetical protein n=1 Tax=Isoptericola sp. S6320L TaxID=2926411 RepID=UPI001FF5E648|nr:hypothetical protein [Isoptericola sp. S6320L]MCK0117000.1 hypothetical protein [Isoptericola sp. S6320L]